MEFFERGGFNKVVILRNQNRRRAHPPTHPPELPTTSRKLNSGLDYVKKTLEEDDIETRLLTDSTLMTRGRESVASMSRMEDLSTVFIPSTDVIDNLNENPADLYTRYGLNEPVDRGSNLKIKVYRDKIIDHIRENRVTIIVGPTGCGKTTQVPQYILESAAERNEYCNIVVTQPRRLAAVSIAHRVSKERNWELGTMCGFKIALHQEVSPDTRISFVTVGVLLSTLVAQRHLANYTHVILDEIHERNCDTDFILLICKRLLLSNSPHVKLVLMSATMETYKFVKYFESDGLFSPESGLICIEDPKPRFQVTIYYLNEIYKVLEYEKRKRCTLSLAEPEVKAEVYDLAIELLSEIESKANNDFGENKMGAVLVFLPGIMEIQEMVDRMTGTMSATGKAYWTIVVLHSSVTKEEQEQVFNIPQNSRKVILATNIAESSITVKDVEYVIDFCLTKAIRVSKDSSLPMLQMQWASKANLQQRAGRVGRVAPGRVFRLIFEELYREMPDHPEPEMLVCPLEQLVLRCKVINFGTPLQTLARALDPPDLHDIELSVMSLKQIGGLSVTLNEEETDEDGELTYLGRLMSVLPLDPRLSKLVMFGHLFNVLEDCIIIAACLSVGSLFSTPLKYKMNAYTSLLGWANGLASDHLAIVSVYKAYNRKLKGIREEWAKRALVQIRILDEMKHLIDDIKNRLSDNMIQTVDIEKNQHIEGRELMVKMAIAAAFYPNYFVRCGTSERIDEAAAVRMLNGCSPYNTVYLSNFPANRMGPLYEEQLRETLRRLIASGSDQSICEQMRITFERGSEKILIEFKDDVNRSLRMPGDVLLGVYRSVFLRHMRTPVTVNVVPDRIAQNYAIPMEEDTDNQANLPGVQMNVIRIKVSHIQSPGRFWAHYQEDLEPSNNWNVLTKLNQPGALQDVQNGKVILNRLYAVLEETDRKKKSWCRARVDSIYGIEATVFFIDYGRSRKVLLQEIQEPIKELQSTLEKVPAKAIECRLSGIKPNPQMGETWCPAAIRFFMEFTSDKILTANVYSVVQGVVSLENLHSDENPDTPVNHILVDRHLAVWGAEGILSSENHNVRQMDLEPAQTSYYNRQQRHTSWSKRCTNEPNLRDCTQRVYLKGPYSPLEIKYQPITQVSRYKDTFIHSTSVNCVLLDTDPNDPYDRVLISSRVSEVATANKLNLFETTHMPHIPGLPAILCLLFSPRAELRMNPSGTLFTSALCGLGVDSMGQAYNSANDIEMPFDCQITVSDLILINEIRSAINFLTDTDNGAQFPNVSSHDVVFKSKAITDKMKELLLKRQREPQAIVLHQNSHQWGVDKEQLDFLYDNLSSRSLYPLHFVPDLRRNLDGLKKNVDVLKQLAVEPNSFYPLECLLCNQPLRTKQELKRHLTSDSHNEEYCRVLGNDGSGNNNNSSF